MKNRRMLSFFFIVHVCANLFIDSKYYPTLNCVDYTILFVYLKVEIVISLNFMETYLMIIDDNLK